MTSLNFKENVPLSDYTTFGIGGPCRYFITAKETPQLQEALKHAHEKSLPVFILGKGSNCLFDQNGFNGLVILNRIDFRRIPSPGIFEVGAGYSFSRLGVQTAREGWTGLEFASGIPCSVGGAIYMNAGAQGQETCDSLTAVEFIDDKGQLHHFQKEELTFSYRTSPFQSMKGAIASATFQLAKDPEGRERQLKMIAYRTATQPYGDKSAGCAFRNPEGHAAGRLIEECGLKGARVGDAEVSPLHANFVINRGSASSDEIRNLIEQIQEKVYKETGILLEKEVRYVSPEGEIS